MTGNQSDNWRADAACKGLDVTMFVPEGQGFLLYLEARAVCERCQVRQPCLDYAMAYPEMVGMFGGLTPEERRLLRKSTA
jgi:WhiB family transcriptional regulator, redox-sensing transcriptional regulator